MNTIAPRIADLIAMLDLLGVAVFALTGALLAARLRQTFVTMAFFALVTGVGGGSVRDLLIGAPVFWVRDPWVAPVCLGIALAAWLSRTAGGKVRRWNGPTRQGLAPMQCWGRPRRWPTICRRYRRY